MSIAAVTNSTAANQSTQQDGARQALTQLVQSIQSGDLTGAQQAYAAFTQAQSTSGIQNNANSPFAQALSQIGQALQSGNIGDAQQALSVLQNQARSGHHHHHRADGGIPANVPVPNVSTSLAPPSGSTLNITV